ncbi:hypothetical protein ENTCAN_05779 [Enterobacter cancerogenus ATCC 35316]|nr:hypothetical protein ENTCAN_05779 [Enterobacter cancerogenus ATCC 35316]
MRRPEGYATLPAKIKTSGIGRQESAPKRRLRGHLKSRRFCWKHSLDAP